MRAQRWQWRRLALVWLGARAGATPPHLHMVVPVGFDALISLSTAASRGATHVAPICLPRVAVTPVGLLAGEVGAEPRRGDRCWRGGGAYRVSARAAGGKSANRGRVCP